MELDGADAEVETVRKVKIIKTGNSTAITVFSEKEIDPATRAGIEAALQAGGYDDEILYIDGSHLDGHGHGLADRRHEVRVIRKKVDVAD